MKAEKWLLGWGLIVVAALCALGFLVYRVDPFFHYHKPDTSRYYYTLDNQRSQNDGIIRHFDYDAMIIGSSMTENFRTSEAERLFQRRFIKTVFNGGSYKEMNDNIEKALETHPECGMVIRCLDIERFFDSWDAMRTDLGEFPTYLYDDNPFNDVKYLLNRDVLFGRVFPMISARREAGFQPGITSFDEYSSTRGKHTFGIGTVCPYGIESNWPAEQEHLTEEDRERIRENIERHVTATADRHPDVVFCYYYPPYSADAWNDWGNQGLLYKKLEAEAFITDLILPHENIRLFSFNNRTDITTNLNHYWDSYHSGDWVNSLILQWIHDGTGWLTADNVQAYRKAEYEFYTTFDYESMNGQEDYAADEQAAGEISGELTGA